MHKYLFLYLMLTSAMLTSANVWGAVNKWVDSQGRIHYSDQTAPADAKASLGPLAYAITAVRMLAGPWWSL